MLLVAPEGLTNIWNNQGSYAMEMFTTPVNRTDFRYDLAMGDISSLHSS